MTAPMFKPGITTLTSLKKRWISNRKIALVTHQAAIDCKGNSSVNLLMNVPSVNLKAIWGPEHGFLGAAPPGEKVSKRKHPSLEIPVYSLYGSTRRPTKSMMKEIDLIVFDLQDLAARPYTYVSTLRLVMEAATEHKKPIVVADRPVPLPSTVDGPMLDPEFESFVAALPLPMNYGMTPGETAMWIRTELGLDIDLKVAELQGYSRETERDSSWPHWIPPSPGIKSWEAGYSYTSTVLSEALPIINIGRDTAMAFRVLGVKGVKSRDICDELETFGLAGVKFHPDYCLPPNGSDRPSPLDSAVISVLNRNSFLPCSTAVAIIISLQRIISIKRLWECKGSRPDFFDKLMGGDKTRKLLQAGSTYKEIRQSWHTGLRVFKKQREKHLIYKP